MASHDLQEPLRKIQTFAGMMETECGECMKDRGKDYLLRIKGSAYRMSGLIKALFDYSRVAVKLSSFQEVDLTAVAREAARGLLDEPGRAGATVEVAELPVVDADPYQMRELFLNLISNALKFRGKDEPPAIKIHGRKERGSCTLFVEDNGIGFDEQYLDKIFTPLQRLHVSGAYAGIGMGLAICRKIAERHGGTITAESVSGKGSTFIISLPCRKGCPTRKPFQER